MATGKRTSKRTGTNAGKDQGTVNKPPRPGFVIDYDIPDGWVPRASGTQSLADIAAGLPTSPGVYIMRDKKGRVVYVGKAQKLRQRVGQYFNGSDTRGFVPMLGRILGDLETIVTTNNKEAMLLENTLIKKYQPRFNVKLRDDKQYLMLRLDPKSAWPRLDLVRNSKKDGALYFGPYHSAVNARQTLRVVNRHFQLRTCTDFVLRSRSRPCLQYQIGRCPAPCVFDVEKDDYAQQVKDVGLFLNGRHRDLAKTLQVRMHEAAESLNFEAAASIRDQIKAIETTLENQRVVGSSKVDQDIIGMFREGGQVDFVVMTVRGGQLMASHPYSEKGMELPDPEVLNSFLTSYYDPASILPDEIVLPSALDPDDHEPMLEWLRDKKSRKVDIVVPERGPRRKLVEMALRNAHNNFTTRRNRSDDTDQALRRLQSRLRLTRLPRRMECYDISHIQGQDPVGSMVVFVDGVADKSLYKRFKIKGVDGNLKQGRWQNDDFASMYEVLTRRIRHGLEDSDEKWALPDLMVIDGGKGQLNQVVAVMQDMGVALGENGVDVISLAKEREFKVGINRATLAKLQASKPSSTSESDSSTTKPGQAYQDLVLEGTDRERDTNGEVDDQPDTPSDDAVIEQTPDSVTGEEVDTEESPYHSDNDVEVRPERVFLPGSRDAIRLRPGSSELFLMTRIRDEAHRFAITHHRERRGKRSLKSVLDDIPGVGPAIKKALIQHFKTVEAIKNAEESALKQVEKVGPSLAKVIFDSLRR